MLWRQASISTGALLGNLEGGSCTGDFESWMKGGSRNGPSLSEEAHSGGPHGRAPLLGTLGYERKALRMGISFRGGSVGPPAVGSSTGDFKRWLKGALEVEHLSLWELHEGNLEGGLPYW